MRGFSVALAVAAMAWGGGVGRAQEVAAPADDVKIAEMTKACPMHSEDAAAAAMNERGAQGMGFSQSATTHHFLLSAKGGAIEVTANDAADADSRDEIHMHLAHIAGAFASGDFDIPMFVHAATPPGVPEMRRLQKEIHYTVEQGDAGGRVVISSDNPEAVAAVHAFLRFQIEEHHTGDPEDVK